MNDNPDFDSANIIDAMAPLIGLDIREDFRPGVAANLKVTAGLAALVLDFPLGDHAESAAVFHP